jgi:hypothetical protein
MFVARQVIRQEGIEHPAFLLGAVARDRRFYQAYDLMMDPDALNYTAYYWDKLAGWAELSLHHPLTDIKEAWQGYRTIDRIVRQEQIGTIYLGDLNNSSCKLTALYYARHGVKIRFYEEGTSHYQEQVHPAKHKWLRRLLAPLMDAAFYLPAMHMCYGRHEMLLREVHFEELPIDRRYSICDHYHEPYDVRLSIERLALPKLEAYLHNSLEGLAEHQRVTLFMSQPLYEHPQGIDRVFLATVEESLRQDKETELYLIKYHPRDWSTMKEEIEAIFRRLGKEYRVIAPDVPLPIEVCLDYLSLSRIMMFGSSTVMYLKYLAPKAELTLLLPDFIRRCEEAGYDTRGYRHILHVCNTI